MFGLSFGAKKQSSTTKSNVDKTETVDQTQSGTQSQTGTIANQGTSSTQSSQASTQNGATTSTGSTTGQQQTQQSGTQFSEPVLGALETSVQNLLGGVSSTPKEIGGSFNHDQFVSQGMEAARSEIGSNLENSINGIFDTVGGRDDQNSMSTLLATKARGEASGALAGANANLEQTAQGIEKDRFLANLQGQATQGGILASVVDALKGGRSATAGSATTAEQNQQAGTSAQTGTQTGSENSQTSSLQTQDLVTAIQQLLQGTTHTVGTETDKTKGSEMGGGLSLGI